MPFHQLMRVLLRKLHDWGYGLWIWADDKLAAYEPEPENCPDCNQPLSSPGADCPTCHEKLENKRRDESIMGFAYEDGYEAGRHSREAEGSW